MNSRLAVLTLSAVLALGPRIASANEGRVEKKVERLTSELGLTEQQAADIRSILESKHAEMDKAWTASTEAAQQKIQAVLTPEQQAKYEEVRKSHHWKKGHGKHKDCPPAEAAPSQ